VIVVGIDPGAGTTGYGVVSRAGGGAVSLLECGVVRTRAEAPLAERLRILFEGVNEVLGRHAVDSVAVEGVFYAKNARTSLVLGHARGAILLAATLADLPVIEYSPAEVKSAVCGTGRATKEQVQYMVQQLLRLREAPRPADAADGIAIALCHCAASPLAERLAAARAAAESTPRRTRAP
jgi:crossover junction endodeoxyribonuclease RuvC